jgi:hypothetical protein
VNKLYCKRLYSSGCPILYLPRYFSIAVNEDFRIHPTDQHHTDIKMHTRNYITLLIHDAYRRPRMQHLDQNRGPPCEGRKEGRKRRCRCETCLKSRRRRNSTADADAEDGERWREIKENARVQDLECAHDFDIRRDGCRVRLP